MLDVSTTLHAIAMLGLVLGLIAGLSWLLRTYGDKVGLGQPLGGKKGGTLKVLQRLPLSAQHTLVEVADGSEKHLIVLSPNSSNLIKSLKSK